MPTPNSIVNSSVPPGSVYFVKRHRKPRIDIASRDARRKVENAKRAEEDAALAAEHASETELETQRMEDEGGSQNTAPIEPEKPTTGFMGRPLAADTPKVVETIVNGVPVKTEPAASVPQTSALSAGALVEEPETPSATTTAPASSGTSEPKADHTGAIVEDDDEPKGATLKPHGKNASTVPQKHPGKEVRKPQAR